MTQDRTPMPADKFTVLGKLAWLWMNSPLHQHWDVNLLSNFALPQFPGKRPGTKNAPAAREKKAGQLARALGTAF